MTENPSDEVLRVIKSIDERLERQKMSDHDLLINLNAVSGQIVSTLREIKDSHGSQMASMETRVKALEEAKWTMLGGATVLGAVAGLVAELLFKH